MGSVRVWKSCSIRKRTKLDGTIKRWLVKGARGEKIFIKSGFTGDYGGVVARCVKHPAS